MPKLTLLKKSVDFEAFRASKLFTTSLLKIRVRSNNQNAPRFGFIVPKKVLAKASDRNKLKRRMKAILLAAQTKLYSADILIFPRALLLKRSFPQLEQEVHEIFLKARLWKS